MAGMWQRKGRKNIYRWLTVFLIFAMVIQIVPWVGVSGFAATDMPENSLKTEAAQSPDEFLPKEELLSTDIDEQIVPIGTIQASEDEGGSEEIIVRFKDDTSLMMMSQTLDSADVLGPITKDQELQLVEVASGEDLAETLAELRKNPRVEYAEPNYRLEAQTMPNDSRWDEQWGLNEVEASAAWDQVGQGTPNQVIVAVLDTGTTEGHEDLQDRLIPGFSTISKTKDQSEFNDDSVNGHGTHLSGIIAAKTNNGMGIAGACGTLPVNILPVKVLDRSGYGTMYDISQGIIQATDQAINKNQKLVINLSLGARLPDYPRTLGDAIKYAQDQGALVIAAAGNDGKEVSGFYPACLEGVVSVGASGVDHSLAKFSNKDAKITAPGVNILSTLPGNKYGTLTGTSQATAFVSATAAVLWSLYPEKNAAEVGIGIQKGQKKFLNNYNVMNMPGALNAVNQGVKPNNDIKFFHPSDSAYVADTVELSVKANIPTEISRVEFNLYSEKSFAEAEEGVVLGEVLGQPASGIYTFLWDSTKVDNGQYRIESVSYDLQGQRLDSDHIYVWVINEQKSGLNIQVKKPDGTMAAKAYVQVYHPEYNKQEHRTIYQMLWQDQADLHGRVIIPGNQATDGNDYLITAIGTEPNFLYYQMARAPQKVVLDDADAVEISIKGNKLDGEPLAGAVIILDLLEANLPNPVSPDQPTSALDQEPVATLDGNGEAKLILSPGRYNFRLLSGEDAYYLVQHDVKIDHDNQIISFQPQAGTVAEVKLDRNPEFYRASLYLKDTEDYFYGFEDLAEGDSMIVSPGYYQGSINAIYRETNPEKEWHWSLETPEFHIIAGEKKTLSYGNLIHGTLENREEGVLYHALNPLYLDPSFIDDHENLTIGIGAQSGFTIEAASGDSEERGIVRLSTRQEENETGLSQNSLKMSAPKAYLYNPITKSFEIKASAIKNIYPKLEIRDSSGELVLPKSNWEQYSSYGYASWYIPATQARGEYTAQVKLQAGPLGENDLVATNEVSFTVGESTGDEESGFTLEVLDRLGQPMVDARVSLLRRVGDAYYPHWSEGERETDWKGQVQYDLELLSEDEFIFAIYGRSPDPTTEIGVDPRTGAPEYLEEPVFLIQALEEDLTSANKVTKTIDTSQIFLNRVVLKALDGTGELINYGQVLYSAYQKLENKSYAGMTLENPYSDEGLALWVSDGSYIFQADQGSGGLIPVSLSEEDEGDDGYDKYPPIYFIQKKIDIAGPLGNDGLIELGRDLLAELKIQIPLSSGDNDFRYAVGGVAFFGKDLPLSPIFSPYENQKIFLSPGNYQGEGVLVLRDQYAGEWDYWLTKDLALASGKSYTWSLDNNFSQTIALDKNSYQLKDILHSTHNFVDGAGNKLVGMATDLGLGDYYEWSKRDLARQLSGENSTFTNSIGSFIEAQNYREIAPFLVIEDPEGQEIYRQKKADPEILEIGYDQEYVYPISKESTFYQGEYRIPEDAEGGRYTAHLELGAGPEGLIKTEKAFFTINAVPGAPLWEALVSPTKAETVSIKGSTMPQALVTLKYSLNEGSLVEVGAVVAGEDGSFIFDSVPLPSEGSYSFVAFASLNDLTGEASLPLVVVVDRTLPAPPLGLGAKGEDQSHILVSWQPSADQDVAYYVLYRNGQELSRIRGNQTLTYLDQGLVSGVDYEYTVIAEDQAGNLSSPVKISGRTAEEGDQLSPSVPANLQGVSMPGGEAKLSWEAATDNVGVTGYQIWRMSGDEEETLIATVNEPNFTDSSLNAETIYFYRVLAFDAGENKSEKSSRVQIIVPPLKVSGLTWHIGRNMNGLPLEEGTLTINFTAERNRQSIAEVVYQSWVDDQGQNLSEPRSVTTSILLEEQGGNPALGLSLYRGSFKLPAGLAALTSLTGIVLDKGGHQATRQGSGFPLYLTGNLSIKISADGEDLSSLDEGKLVVWSDSVGGGKTVNFSGLGIYSVPGLTPGENYELQVFDGQGNQLLWQKDISVIGGMGKELDIKLPLPAALDIQVVDEKTGLAVPGVRVDYSLANGRYLATGTSGLDGWVKNSAGMGPVTPFLLSGTEVKARASLDQEQRNFYQSATMVEKTLLSGVNKGEIKLKGQSMGKLKGAITDSNGTALADARIVVSQWLEGRLVSYNTETDAQGKYELALLAGTAQATFSHRKASSKILTVSITEGLVTEQDIELPMITTVTLAVFTKGAGDDQKRPLDLDWRVGIHFRIRWVNITTGTSSVYTPMGDRWPDIAIPGGKQGDEIKISVDGKEGGLSKGETIVTLDETGWAKAEITLNEQGRITAKVRDEGGVRHGSLPVTMELYYFDPENPEVWSPLSDLRAITLSNGKSQPVPAGRYKGIVYWGPYRSNIVNPTTGETVYFTDGVKIADFTVVDGEITDLGDINLPLSYLGNGVFRGKEGNSFAANVSAAAPGEVITLRAAYHYSGAGNAHPQNIKLRLAIPKGGELVPDSTLVRTISGRAVYEETAQNQMVFNLEKDTQSAQLEGTISYQVRLKTEPDWPTTAAKALISYTMNGYNSTGLMQLQDNYPRPIVQHPIVLAKNFQ